MAGGARVLRPPGTCKRPRGDLTGPMDLLIGGCWVTLECETGVWSSSGSQLGCHCWLVFEHG